MNTIQQNFKTYYFDLQNALNEVEKVRSVLHTCKQNSPSVRDFFENGNVGITGSYFLIRKKGKSIAIPQDIQNISVNPNDKNEVATIEEVFNFINTIPSLVKNVFSLYEKDAFTKMETFVVGISCDAFESVFEKE